MGQLEDALQIYIHAISKLKTDTEEQQQTMEDQIADETAQGGHSEDDPF